MSAPKAQSVANPISDFLSDIEPFFYKRSVIYADVGANDGSTFEAVLDMGFSIDRAVLIEANPRVFIRLQKNVATRNTDDKFTCLNLAISDQRGVVRLRDMQDMRRTVSATTGNMPAEEAGADPNHHVEVEARRFEDLADFFPDRHVSILKINVEGHEMQVLRGCDSMLIAAAIEVLYVEVGVTADNPQEASFRRIDDLVTSHGYRLFKIYEQTHNRIEDSPVLRRFNVAYFSPTITARYPMALTNELSRLRRDLDASEKDVATLTGERDAARAEAEKQALALKERYKEIALLTRSFETIIAERDAARADVELQIDENEIRRKKRLLFGVLGVYLLALAAAIPIFLWYF